MIGGVFICKSMFLFSWFPSFFLSHSSHQYIPDTPWSAVISWYLEELLYLTTAGCIWRQQSLSAKGNMLDAVVSYFSFLPSLFSTGELRCACQMELLVTEIMGLADAFPFVQLGCLLSLNPAGSLCERVKQACLHEACLPSGPSLVLWNWIWKGWDTRYCRRN